MQSRLYSHPNNAKGGFMPKCQKCFIDKPLEGFRINGARPDGSPRPRTVCKTCGSQWKVEHTEPKKCTHCQVTKEASEFGPQGLWTRCRACKNKSTYAYRRGAGRAAHNARMALYQKEKYKTDPEFRLKTAARNAVNLAVKVGVLTKPEACPHCNRRVRIHGHHHNGYEKAHWLEVTWCCAKCHRELETS